MKSNLLRMVLAVLCAGGMLVNAQAALKSAKVSDYKGDVTLSKNGGSGTQVHLDSTVTPSDTVRTGPKSLAELQFNDNTLTRLGANTVFSYSPENRQFEVQSGTALLQVPPGLGGAKIETAAVTAAITGTTVMIQKLPSGVVKLMVLEGSMNATLKGSNQLRIIKAGQMLIILPNVNTLPQPIVINVATVMGTSKLIRGFKTELVSTEKIDKTEQKQKELTGNGGLKSGGVVITTTKDLINLIGNGVLTSATFDSLTQRLNLTNDSDFQQPSFSGPVVVDTGARLVPTANGTLGTLTLATGQVITAVAGSDPGDTTFSITGPLTFTNQLPLISPGSQGNLDVLVTGPGLSASDPAISFINSTNNPASGTFYSNLFEAASGAINFSNADFSITDTTFIASSGDVNVSNGSTLAVDQGGQALLYAGGKMNIDSSGVEVIDSTPGASIALYSGGTMTVSNSTVGSGVSTSVSLSSQGNMSIVNNSLIGGVNVASVVAYAHNNGNLMIMNSSVIGNTLVFGGLTASFVNSNISGTSITIYTNNFVNSGSTFSTTPNVQPYVP